MSEIAAIKQLQRRDRQRISNFSTNFVDGWQNMQGDTWTYASASTFTVTGDVTGSYQAGMFVKWTQTTVKFGAIVSASYSDPSTTITITGDTITDATITENYVSRGLSPQGSDLADLSSILPLKDHDHTGDAGDGGKLEADDALQVTGGTTGHVLTVQADDTIAAAALPALADHDHSGDAGDGGVLPMQFYLGYYTSTAWDGDAKNGADGIIDLSAAFGVPAGVKAVSCRFAAIDETTNVVFRLSQDSDPTAFGVAQRTQVANMYIHVSGIVPCDANGDIYFSQSGELDGVAIEITGYWI